MELTPRFSFRVPIGDWTGDGHGNCIWYRASATRPISDVREAFFRAREMLRVDLHPEVICSEYGKMTISQALVKEIKDLAGINLSYEETQEDLLYVETDTLAEYVVWFINQGDPSIDAHLEPQEATLPFSGYDTKNRHIGFIGYGLFGE